MFGPASTQTQLVNGKPPTLGPFAADGPRGRVRMDPHPSLSIGYIYVLSYRLPGQTLTEFHNILSNNVPEQFHPAEYTPSFLVILAVAARQGRPGESLDKVSIRFGLGKVGCWLGLDKCRFGWEKVSAEYGLVVARGLSRDWKWCVVKRNLPPLV